MSIFFSKHARQRGKKRNIGQSKMKRLMTSGGGKYLGGGRYRATKKIDGRSTTMIYRKNGSRRIAITGWKG